MNEEKQFAARIKWLASGLESQAPRVGASLSLRVQGQYSDRCHSVSGRVADWMTRVKIYRACTTSKKGYVGPREADATLLPDDCPNVGEYGVAGSKVRSPVG